MLKTFLRSYRDLIALLLLAAISFWLASWGAERIFEYLPHVEDEVAFVFQAKLIAAGEIIGRAPEYPQFFRIPFVVVRDGDWFGKYPPGWPIVLSLGVLIGQTWIVNALGAAVAVFLTGWIGRRRYSSVAGLLAAGLLVASPFFFLQSSSLMSHVSSLVWAMLALLCYLHWRDNRTWLAAVGVGFSIGFLFLSRPLTGVGIGLPLAVLLLVDILRRRSIRGPLIMAATFAPFLLGFLAYNQATTGDPFTSAYVLVWEYDKIGFGPDVGRFGHDFGRALHNLKLNSDELSELLFGWPYRLSLLPVLLAAVVAVVRAVQSLLSRGADRLSDEHRLDLLLAAMAISLIGVHFAYWAAGNMYGPRYYFEAIGALALLGARGIILIVRGLAQFVQAEIRPARPLAIGIVAIALVLLTGYSASVSTPEQIDRYHGWYGITDQRLKDIESHDLKNALVFVPRENWEAYAPFFVQNSPDLDGNVIYAVDRGVRNQQLIRLYPDRTVYVYEDGKLAQVER